MRLKTDSFVVETDTHFPTDYTLLWDSARKCIAMVEKLQINGWRKANDWHRALKKLMRSVGQASSGGGKNKQERVAKIVGSYLKKAKALEKKVALALKRLPCTTPEQTASVVLLSYYHKMLTKHIGLLERRIIKGETIPHSEKLFSIFQPYTEWINKGKLRPNVEIGKKLFVTSDQYQLIVDWQIGEKQTDNQLTLPIAQRLNSKYPIQSLSVDKGFSSQADKALLETFIPEVIMPKKGKCSQAEKAIESAPTFKQLKNKHSAIESNINELEHRGLDRCPDRTRKNFDRYIGLGITAYNLHKIGKALLAQRRTEEERQATLLKAA